MGKGCVSQWLASILWHDPLPVSCMHPLYSNDEVKTLNKLVLFRQHSSFLPVLASIKTCPHVKTPCCSCHFIDNQELGSKSTFLRPSSAAKYDSSFTFKRGRRPM